VRQNEESDQSWLSGLKGRKDLSKAQITGVDLGSFQCLSCVSQCACSETAEYWREADAGS
jgi:hypothetical protein